MCCSASPRSFFFRFHSTSMMLLTGIQGPRKLFPKICLNLSHVVINSRQRNEVSRPQATGGLVGFTDNRREKTVSPTGRHARGIDNNAAAAFSCVTSSHIPGPRQAAGPPPLPSTPTPCLPDNQFLLFSYSAVHHAEP